MGLLGWSWRGWASLLGACLICISGGAINSFGNMIPYVVSYMRHRGKDKDMTYQVALSCSGVLFATSAIGTAVGVWSEEHFGLRKSVLCGSLIGWIGMVSSFWSIRVSYVLFVFTYGTLYGLSAGLVSAPPSIAAMKLLPRNRGMVLGITQGCVGLGGVIFSFTKTLFINPGNLEPDVVEFEGERTEKYYTQDSVLNRTPSSFLLQAGICVVLQIVGLVLYYDLTEDNVDTEMESILEKRHENIGDSSAEKTPQNTETACLDEQKGHETSDGDFGGTVSEDPLMSGLSLDLCQMIKRASLWQFLAMNIACVFSGVAVMGSYKTFGLDFIADDILLSGIGSVASLANFFGNTLVGLAVDRFSIKVTSVVLCGSLSAMVLILPSTRLQGRLLYALMVSGVFFNTGGATAIQPVFAVRAYGEEHFVGNVIFITVMSTVVPNILAILTSLIQHFFSWETLFISLGVIPGIAMFAGMFMNLKNGQNQYV